jgi:hypothetical protein
VYPIRRPNSGSLPPTETLADVFGVPLRSRTDHAFRNERAKAL